MWTYAKTDWNSTDFFEYAEYNRIKNNIIYLIELAFSINEKWKYPNIDEINIRSLFYAKVFNVIEENLELLANNTFRANNFEVTKEFFENNTTWNNEDVNRIERTTLLYYYILNSQYSNRSILSFELGGDFFG